MAHDLIRAHIAKALRAAAEVADREVDAIEKAEADGYRIVSGGPEYDDGADAFTSWTVTDWDTGEVIASGPMSNGDDYGEGVEAAETAAGERWFHVDHLFEDFRPPEVPPTPGIPTNLADALEEWASEDGDAARAYLDARQADEEP